MKKIFLLTLILSSTVLLAYTGIENSKSSDFDSPCELISLEEVKKRFDLDASIEISVEDKDYTYPTCSFNWNDGKLLIIMVKDASESNYETSISVYPDGQNEDSIGDKACWSAKRAQLTFLFNSYLFHVHVRASNDDVVNKKVAIEIAGDIIAKL